MKVVKTVLAFIVFALVNVFTLSSYKEISYEAPPQQTLIMKLDNLQMKLDTMNVKLDSIL